MNKLAKFFDLGFRQRRSRASIADVPPEMGAVPPEHEIDQGAHPATTVYAVDGKTTLLLYVAVAFGVLAKHFVDYVAKPGAVWDWRVAAVSMILAAVGFPRIFQDRLTKVPSAALRVFIAFENGFFIDAVIRAIAAVYQRS